ncbi:MAG: efflux RND transporter permease subunit, partial [Candidatus Binatia bacterium]
MRGEGSAGSMLSRYIRWVTDHAIAVVVVFAIATVGFTSRLAALHVEINPDSQLPQHHRYVEALNRLHEVFGEKNLVFIGLFPKGGDIYEPAIQKKLGEVTARIRELPGVVERTYSSLALPRAVDIRGSADGMIVTPLLDPLPETRAEVLSLRERLRRNPHLLGVLAARDGSAAAIIADFDFTPPLSGYPEVKAAIDRVLADAQDGTFDAHLGGPAIYMAWLAHYSARMVFFFPLALVVIGIVHYEAFRTVQAIVLPLATAILAMLWSLGMLGILGVPLDPFNVTTPILILAVAAGHAVQLLKRFYEEKPHLVGSREAVVRSIGQVGPVMIVAGLIAALSFLSLLTFQTASIRNFGLLTALGILSALAIEMTFIPAVRSLLPTPSSHERSREGSRHFFDPATEELGRWLTGGAWRTVLIVAAVTAALFAVAAYRVE